MQDSRNEKPGRPFGVTIAIIVSVVVYSLIPLAQIGLILSAEDFFNDQRDAFTIPFEGNEVETGESGGSIIDNNIDPLLLIQIGLSIVFIVIAYLAWRGSPSSRLTFIGTVLLMTIFSIAIIVGPLLEQNTGSSGGSLDGFFASLQVGQLALILLVPVYVVWYLNRAPARAFYRGYYLEQPEQQNTDEDYEEKNRSVIT